MKMETDLAKLFVGGISWDTDEIRLKEYFKPYGEVVESTIMRDRVTGRSRGFGFVVFRDPGVAERVLMDKHMIDGRTVEAKKAVPRDDQQHVVNRNISIIQGSPTPGRTKKIFVGGLASTVTESDFKRYFEQFGTITDVVVMYDHNTQRPRGFGFITYDSEEAVDRVLHKTFHDLNGKMVEVKRAVPKELSPSPNRSPLVGYTYGLDRASTLMNNYGQGYNLNSIGGYGRFNPITSGRSALPPFAAGGYGMGLTMQPGFSTSYGGSSSTPGYGRILGPYLSANSNRYPSPIGYNVGNSRNDSLFNTSPRTVFRSGSFNNVNSPSGDGAILAAGSGNFYGSFGNSTGAGVDWGSSPVGPQSGSSPSRYIGRDLAYGLRDVNGRLEGGNHGRNNGSIASAASASAFAGSTANVDTAYTELYHGGSPYGDSTWRTSPSELDSGSFGFRLGNPASDDVSKTSEEYIGSYSVTNRQPNRGNGFCT
ncbi:Heterogeneous nuclear ribonucleoprotein 1-like protein [Drosera capensis]